MIQEHLDRILNSIENDCRVGIALRKPMFQKEKYEDGLLAYPAIQVFSSILAHFPEGFSGWILIHLEKFWEEIDRVDLEEIFILNSMDLTVACDTILFFSTIVGKNLCPMFLALNTLQDKTWVKLLQRYFEREIDWERFLSNRRLDLSKNGLELNAIVDFRNRILETLP